MRKLALLCILTSATANAEVFKCIEKYGKTIYQASPCKPAEKEQQLDIKSDPAKEAEAKAKLEAIQSEYETRKIAQEQKDKELELQREKAVSLEISRRNVIAEQQQAQAQQKMTEALQRQNLYGDRLLYITPPPIPTLPPPRPLRQQPGPNNDYHRSLNQ